MAICREDVELLISPLVSSLQGETGVGGRRAESPRPKGMERTDHSNAGLIAEIGEFGLKNG